MKKRFLMAAFITCALLMSACGNDKDVAAVDKQEAGDVASDVAEDGSVTEQADVANETADENGQFSYASLATTSFSFSSGAGGWSTELDIDSEGNFTGAYHDSDMGDTADAYPNGTIYICNFKGRFGALQKVDDLTYKTTVESLEVTDAKRENDEEISEGTRFVYSLPYGLDDPKDIYFYLPGTKTSALSEGVMSWVGPLLYDYTTESEAKELPFLVLYNENSEEAFVGNDMLKNVKDNISWMEDYDSDYQKNINEAATDAEKAEISGYRFEMWDNYLNDIWSVITKVKPEDEMSKIRDEERAWIKDKDEKVKQAGEGAADENLKKISENTLAAELTKDRCVELVKLLQ